MEKKKRKRDPKRAEFEAQSEANLRKLRELVERGWAELEDQRRRNGRAIR